MDFKKNTKCQFALGIAICFAVAAASVLLEELIPGGLLGHPSLLCFWARSSTAFFILPGSNRR